MTKVSPSEVPCEPSTSMSSPKPGFLGSMANKVFGFVLRTFDRRESTSSTDSPVEVIVTNGRIRSNSAGKLQVPAQVYQQSSTRRLAFGESSCADESKPINDFYNNSTLANISKLFCAVVLIIAFVLVMSRSFSNFANRNGNETATYFF